MPGALLMSGSVRPLAPSQASRAASFRAGNALGAQRAALYPRQHRRHSCRHLVAAQQAQTEAAGPVTDNNFKELVLESNVPVIVDFWAPWCGPCRMIAPLVDELAIEYEGKIKAVIKRMHKVSEDSRLGVQGSLWGSSAYSEVQASACGLIAKAVGQGIGFAHEKGAAAVEGSSPFIETYKLNTDESPGVALEYGIRSIPTVMLFKDGSKQETIIGAVPKSTLSATIEKFI